MVGEAGDAREVPASLQNGFPAYTPCHTPISRPTCDKQAVYKARSRAWPGNAASRVGDAARGHKACFTGTWEAEEVGFEPTVPCGHTGFRDRPTTAKEQDETRPFRKPDDSQDGAHTPSHTPISRLVTGSAAHDVAHRRSLYRWHERRAADPRGALGREPPTCRPPSSPSSAAWSGGSPTSRPGWARTPPTPPSRPPATPSTSSGGRPGDPRAAARRPARPRAAHPRAGAAGAARRGRRPAGRRCRRCGHPLGGDDPQPLRHQVAELPPVDPEVVEYRLHRLTLPAAAAPSPAAACPPGVPARGVRAPAAGGPRPADRRRTG